MVDHIVHHDIEDSGMSAVMMVVLFVALLAIAAFAFFALNSRPAVQGDTDRDIDIEGEVDVPGGIAPETNPTDQAY